MGVILFFYTNRDKLKYWISKTLQKNIKDKKRVFVEILTKEDSKRLGLEISYSQSLQLKNEAIWINLKNLTVERAIAVWIETFQGPTKKNYKSAMMQLLQMGLLNPMQNLQEFSLSNQEDVLDKIKLRKDWSESTRQARAAAYISFTNFLHRRTQGLVRKAIPSRDGASKTFYKIREKVATPAMNQSQWLCFLQKLEKINYRDSLIAKTMLHGGKRVKEVLSVKVDQIDFENGSIKFIQSKTKGYYKEVFVSYPKNFMDELKNHLGERSGFLFVTKNGKQLYHMQVQRTFSKAGKNAKIPFKVTPHVLRSTFVTYLKSQGFADSEIMKVTGHASSEMVHAYDRNDQKDNISNKISFF